MAAEITEITERNQLSQDERDGLLLAINDRLARVEAELTRLLGAWSSGGLMGLRKAARDGRH